MACIGFLQIIGRIFIHIRHVVWHSEPFQANLSIMLYPLPTHFELPCNFLCFLRRTMSQISNPQCSICLISLELDREISTWYWFETKFDVACQNQQHFKFRVGYYLNLVILKMKKKKLKPSKIGLHKK